MRVIYIFLIVSALLFTGCGNEKDYESARKPHIMYNGNLYGLSAHLPKSHAYESINNKLKKVGVIEGNVLITELPAKNFETNVQGYVGADIYTDAEGNMQTLYVRIKNLEDDKFIRFDLNSDMEDKGSGDN